MGSESNQMPQLPIDNVQILFGQTPIIDWSMESFNEPLIVKPLVESSSSMVRFEFHDGHQDNVKRFFENWHALVHERCHWKNKQMKLLGHRVDYSEFWGGGSNKTTIFYHPFITAYFIRKDYIQMRTKMLMMKGMLRNKKR